jgi:Tfp pilus assembly protein PilX
MNQSDKGFVLLIILVFMQIFSILTCVGLASVSAAIRINRDAWQSYTFKKAAVRELDTLETALLTTGPQCVIPILPAGELARKSISWWQEYSCSSNLAGFRYYYVTENLGKDSCSLLDKDTDHIVIADYYRITLLALPAKKLTAKLILQSTMVKASNDSLPCDRDKHLVTAGRQMQRELTGKK